MNPTQLEEEVANIARRLWSLNEGDGAIKFDGRERDGIYITEEMIHLVECTVSPKKEKARKDISKLVNSSRQIQRKYPYKGVKGWFITLEEPTADQRGLAKKEGFSVVALSFKEFQKKIMDIRSFVQYREDYPFGSIRDPKTNGIKLSTEVIKIGLVEKEKTQNLWAIDKISDSIIHGKRFAITGEYGVGKSVTLRQIYYNLLANYTTNKSPKFPIFINLRDHHGQKKPSEVLRRHAENIGFPNPSHLVRAWRAGYVYLLLDGFDEIAVLGYTDKAAKLRNIRYQSMQVIREFVRDTPNNIGLVLAGRSNFFDSLKECREALQLDLNVKILSVDDFTDAQVKDYLKRNNIETGIPNWLPSRPLLLGHLAAKGLFSKIVDGQQIHNASEGWDFLLDAICQREANMEVGISPNMVRQIIEKLACHSRCFASQLGPIFQTDLERIFRSVAGFTPNDLALVVLQRLPGLGVKDQQDGARYFIDATLAQAAMVREIANFIVDPFNHDFGADAREWNETMDSLGGQMLSHYTEKFSLGLGHLTTAITHAQQHIGSDTLAMDIILAYMYRDLTWDKNNVLIEDITIKNFKLDELTSSFNGLELRSCIIKDCTIPVDEKIANSIPVFRDCIFGTVLGISNERDVPSNFIECVYETFEDRNRTTNLILGMPLSTPAKVALTILKKLYIQAGSGRKENAFYRGLSHRENRFIPDVLKLLRQEGYALEPGSGYKKIWQANRAKNEEVRQLILSPNPNNGLIKQLDQLT